MGSSKKRRRKRCRACEELFHPDRRVGSRQQYCGGESCQLARKRDYQRQWRSAHPAEDRGRRLRETLQRDTAVAPRPAEPLARVPWDEVESELGLGTSTVLKCVIGVVVRWLVRSGTADRGRLADGEARSAETAESACCETEIASISAADAA